MSGVGTTAFRSILEKPLNQLTEDDISQLTREDCRKYLKEKGMRRPSWNKSQAIQQVISLKALLEPDSDDSGAGALRKIVSSSAANHNPPRVSTFSVASNSAEEVSVSAEDSGPAPQKSVTETEDRLVVADGDERPSPRSQCGTDGVVGQMTIFYCGKVNVYDQVPPEKAKAIMHLAASPIHFSRENLFGGTGSVPRCFPWNSLSGGGPLSPSGAIPQHPIQTEKVADYGQQCPEKDNDMDGQASRKVSLQRYLEKRKDRTRMKIKKNPGFCSSSLDVYLNHHSKSHITNSNSSRSSTSSPTPPGQPKMSSLPVDLNEKHNLDC